MGNEQFDELAKKLATPISRRQSLIALAAAAVGGLVASGPALAKGRGNDNEKGNGNGNGSDRGNSACAHYCQQVCGEDDECHGKCTSAGAHCMNGNGPCTGVCYNCGPNGTTTPGTVACASSSGGYCANLSTDVHNCGACGKVCGTGETCVKGTCMCGSGAACGTGTTCVNGSCQATCTAGAGTSTTNTCGGNGATCGKTATTGNPCYCLTAGDGSGPYCVSGVACPGYASGATPCNANADCATSVDANGNKSPGVCLPAGSASGTVCCAPTPGYTGYCAPFCSAVP